MPPTILIAEDYDDNRELMRLLLAGANYEVREARNGRECLELAREDPPDLIMVDLSMPGLDGWEVFQSMRAADTMKHIPVIVITAKAQSIDKVLGLHIAKVEDYITKPFAPAELVQSVRKVLADAKAQSRI